MSKTPRTDDFVECYATGMNREVAPHHKFMRVADFARQLETENAELLEGVLRVAQLVEGLKLPCSMDPESPQAIRNGTYQSIALIARALLARVEGK